MKYFAAMKETRDEPDLPVVSVKVKATGEMVECDVNAVCLSDDIVESFPFYQCYNPQLDVDKMLLNWVLADQAYYSEVPDEALKLF